MIDSVMSGSGLLIVISVSGDCWTLNIVVGLIIGVYGDGQQPGNCRANVERIRDYLVTAGY